MLDRRLKFDQIPDTIIVNVKPNTCKIVEIKLGDNFDTKKAQGEVDHLKKYADKFQIFTDCNDKETGLIEDFAQAARKVAQTTRDALNAAAK